MAATFLLIRHAAHVDLDAKLSGRSPGIPLSPAGLAQAARLGQALATEPIAAIVASPLDRTRATATAIAQAHQPPLAVQVDEQLIEIDMGDWTGRVFDTLAGDPAWLAWNTRRGSARVPGGETMGEAQGRIVAVLDRLARDGDGAVIVVVSHSDMIRAAVAHVLGLPLDNLLRFDIGPASITRIVWGDWGARLMSLNGVIE